ncbi:MAG: YbaB/EbfC family nucleoid-associated protein [Rhodospirillales bacterium]
MTNLADMMKQAQKLQSRMSEMQERLADVEVTGAAGGGMVQVTLSGKVEARRVKIDPSLAAPGEVEVLEDLIVAAFNDAKAKVDAQVAEKMSELTGGMALPPGLKLPF